jgi:peptide/nickel transport system substrate-binding protein
MRDDRLDASLRDVITRQMSRRTALKVFGGGVTASIVAACSGTNAPSAGAPSAAAPGASAAASVAASASAAPASAAPSAASAAPASSAPSAAASAGGAAPKGTLGIANPGEPNFIDPAMALENYEFAVVRNVYEGLVQWNEDWSDFEPALATSWESNADATEWTFTLREGVTFHDGTPFNSTAVKATLEHYDPATTNWGFLMQGISNIDDSDPQVVKLTFETPSPDILRNQVFVKMMSPQLLTSGQSGEQAVGTGPYKWGSRVKGTSITLTANPDYWNAPEGGPHFETVNLQSIADTNAAVSALEGGAVNIVPRIDPLHAQQLQANQNLVVNTIKSWLVIHLIFRTDQGPLKDVRVRQAIAHGLDRDAIIQGVLLGQAEKATSLMPPGTYGRVEPATIYDFNPDKAKQLLADAGFAGGVDLRLASGNSAPFPLVGQAIASQLKDVGINLQAEALEPGVAVNDVLVSETPQRTILLSTYGWINGGPFHFGVRTVVNHPHYTEKPLLDLVDKVNQTPDGPERLQALADAQEMYAQVIPDFPLWYPVVTDVHTANLKGYEPPVDAYQIDFTRASFE